MGPLSVSRPLPHPKETAFPHSCQDRIPADLIDGPDRVSPFIIERHRHSDEDVTANVWRLADHFKAVQMPRTLADVMGSDDRRRDVWQTRKKFIPMPSKRMILVGRTEMDGTRRQRALKDTVHKLGRERAKIKRAETTAGAHPPL